MKRSVTVSDLMSKGKGTGKGSGANNEGYLEQVLRGCIKECMELILDEELECALGTTWYQRAAERHGYRKGRRTRTITTTCGTYEISVPRGTYVEPGKDGKREWNSQVLPRYARRTAAIEEALLRTYLCGTNTRKIKTALSPLLEGAALSKSTISRIVSRLKEHYEAWHTRDLSSEDVGLLFLDGFNLKLRLGRKVESFPVLSVVGVRSDGSKVLLTLEVRTSESTIAWAGVCEDLARRGVARPVTAVIDGCKGLGNAVKTTWPWIEVQRCCKHKWENLKTYVPKRDHEELKEDYDAIVYHADSEAGARKAYQRFELKWSKRCPGVVKSLHEAGDELLTFYQYPQVMWKAIRTTNCVERVNEEFRRRTKTQGSFPNADAGLILLFGLFAYQVIKMNRIRGHQQLAALLHAKRKEYGLLKEIDEAA